MACTCTCESEGVEVACLKVCDGKSVLGLTAEFGVVVLWRAAREVADLCIYRQSHTA